jgi:hypothetical protein
LNEEHRMKKLIVASLMLSASALAIAKLPAPAVTPESQLKAAEAAAKTAHTAKVANYQLCKSQDKAAKLAKNTKAPEATPPCADPGAFTFTPPVAAVKPIEAAGAHSPAPTAAAPPSTQVPAAVTMPTTKAPAKP